MTAVMTERPRQHPTSGEKTLRWLFYKERFAWPRASGHDVHTYFLMEALAREGHSISLATVEEPPPEAILGIDYAKRYVFAAQNPPIPEPGAFPIQDTKSTAKFRNYWGVSEDKVRQFAAAAKDCQADVVVVSGLNVLPLLGAVQGAKKVWYAADEWVWHHLSMFRPLRKSTWHEVKDGLVKGMYERAYRHMLDRVWVVSSADAKAFKWFAGMPQTDILPNGVDTNLYAPLTPRPEVIPNSCVFWGRLDFGPNIQAVEWFAQKIWPLVRAKVPTARLRIYGFQPTPAVTRFAGKDGIDVTADVPDIRAKVQECGVVVLPFVSGGGIKNKLLEASGMAMPIVATRRTTHGLKGSPPLRFADKPQEYVAALTELWSNAAQAETLGQAARTWVKEHHTWDSAARTAAEGIMPRETSHR
jgi:polysaccharide biosynthesis protein PslH